MSVTHAESRNVVLAAGATSALVAWAVVAGGMAGIFADGAAHAVYAAGVAAAVAGMWLLVGWAVWYGRRCGVAGAGLSCGGLACVVAAFPWGALQ